MPLENELYTNILTLEKTWKTLGHDNTLIIEGIKDVKILLLQIAKNFMQKEANKDRPVVFISLDDREDALFSFIEQKLGWKMQKNQIGQWKNDKNMEIPIYNFNLINDQEIDKINVYEPTTWKNPFSFFEHALEKFEDKSCLIILYNLNTFLTNNIKGWDSDNEILEAVNEEVEFYRSKMKEYTKLMICSVNLDIFEEKEKILFHNRLYHDIFHTLLSFKEVDWFDDGRVLKFMKLTNIFSSADSFWCPFFYLNMRGLYSIEEITANFILGREGFDFKIEKFELEIKNSLELYLNQNIHTPSEISLTLPFEFPSIGKDDVEPIRIKGNRIVSVLMPWSVLENYGFICHLIHESLRQGFPVLYLGIDDNPNNVVYYWGDLIDGLEWDQLSKNKKIQEVMQNVSLNRLGHSFDKDPLKSLFKQVFQKNDRYGMIHYLNTTNGIANQIFSEKPEKFVDNLKGITNLSAVFSKIEEFDHAMIYPNPGEENKSQGFTLIINSYSGLYNQVGQTRANNFLQTVLNELLDKNDKNRFIFNIVQKNMIPAGEVARIEQLSDALIEFKVDNVLGSTLNSINLRGGFEGMNFRRNVYYFIKELDFPVKYVLLNPLMIENKIKKLQRKEKSE